MLMEISAYSSDLHDAVLAHLRAMPYQNAIVLSNVTQLRSRCDVLVAHEQGRVMAVASTYHDLPIANLVFTARNAPLARAMIDKLVQRTPRLQQETIWALLPEDRYHVLQQCFTVEAAPIEYQMGVEPETLRIRDHVPTRRLTAADLPAMNHLAEAAGLSVWDETALDLGPFFGCFVDDTLVAMAGTHFITPEAIEIGHVACHPDHRRRGYASVCVSALTQAAFALSQRVFLMVIAENTPALEAYKQLGFRLIDRFYLSTFKA
jgi:ribosomal protein S18 acetylase RimI-like enzyme